MVKLPVEKLEQLTLAELEAQLQYVDAELQDIRAYKQKVHDTWENKLLRNQAEARLARLNESERKALLQAMSPAGIKSEEAVNKK